MSLPEMQGDWSGTKLKDLRNQKFQIGDKVARAYTSGRTCNLEIRTVTRIENGKLYLNDSKVAINYPGRLLIVNKVFE